MRTSGEQIFLSANFVGYRVAKTDRIPYLYRSFFCKSDLCLVALLWKIICNLGDPMSLRHPVPHESLGALQLAQACGKPIDILSHHMEALNAIFLVI